MSNTMTKYRYRPLSERGISAINKGEELFKEIETNDSLELFTSIKTFIVLYDLPDTQDSEQDALNSLVANKTLQDLNGTPTTFMSFVHNLAKEHNSILAPYDMNYLYKCLFEKPITPRTLAQVGETLGIYDKDTSFVDNTPETETNPNEIEMTEKKIELLNEGVSAFEALDYDQALNIYLLVRKFYHNQTTGKENKKLKTLFSQFDKNPTAFMGYLVTMINRFDSTLNHRKYTQLYRHCFKKNLGHYDVIAISKYLNQYEQETDLTLPPQEHQQEKNSQEIQERTEEQVFSSQIMSFVNHISELEREVSSLKAHIEQLESQETNLSNLTLDQIQSLLPQGATLTLTLKGE